MAKLDDITKELTGEQNTYCFDGLYGECYIRLESDDINDIKKALNEIYK